MPSHHSTTKAKARARRAFGDRLYLPLFFLVVVLGFSLALAGSFLGAAFFFVADFLAGFFGSSPPSSSSASAFALGFFGAALAFFAGASSFASVSSLKATNSRMATSAASPRRGPRLMIRMY